MTERAGAIPVLAGHGAAIVITLGMLWAVDITPDVLSETGWWWSFLAVHGGAFLGTLTFQFLSASPRSAEALQAEGRRADLEQNRREVVQQLKNLEAERDKLSEEDFAREHATLVRIGADASRALAEHDLGPAGVPTTPGTSPATIGPVESLVHSLQAAKREDPAAFDAALAHLGIQQSAPAGEWRGAFYTLVIVAIVAGFYTLAADSARQRGAGMPMTGGDSIASTSPPPMAASSSANAPLPNDITALNQLTEKAIVGQDLGRAMELNTRALEVDPKSTDARVWRAVLVAFIGQREKAYEELDGIIAEDPNHLNALIYRALLSMRQDPKRAAELLEKAIELSDDPRLKELLAQANSAPPPPPAAPPPPAPPPSATGEIIVSGRITLDAEAAADAGQVLFVSLVAPTGGPPLASLRLPPGPFPMDFALGPEHRIMMGGDRPIPDNFNVKIRLDSDGNPMTRPPSDPQKVLEKIARGTKDLEVHLN